MTVRPGYDAIVSAQQSWDGVVNDNFDVVLGGAFPVFEVADVATLLAVNPASYVNCLAVTADTFELWKSDGTNWRIVGTATGHKNASGARYYDVIETNELTLSGATGTWSGAFPAGAINRAVSSRVTELITSGDGADGFHIGDGTDDDRYAQDIAFTAGGTTTPADSTADPTTWTAAAGDVVVTATTTGTPAGTFSGGKVRLCVGYRLLTAPTA